MISDLQQRTPPLARGIPMAKWQLEHGHVPVTYAEKLAFVEQRRKDEERRRDKRRARR
jgi:hypothetical protein